MSSSVCGAPCSTTEAVSGRRAFLLAAMGALTPLRAQNHRNHRLPPVDESASDSSFLLFRNQLQEAVNRQNSRSLLDVVSPTIRVSFGEAGGQEEFRRTWKLNQPNSPIWSTLNTLLRLGCTREPSNQFAAPYVYSRFPQDLDAFQHVVATQSQAALRSAPNAKAAVRERLQWDILQLVQPQPSATHWRHVRSAKGKTGYVRVQDVYSPIGYRAFFAQEQGAWRLITLVAGD